MGRCDTEEEHNHSAEVYYRFATLGSDDFEKQLNELREVLGLELEEIDGDDVSDDLLLIDGDGESDDDTPATSRRAPQKLKLEKLLEVIYHVHAATELGHFVFDWSVLPDDYPAKDVQWLKEQYGVVPINERYNVVYDGGKLMDDFLAFMRNNRNKDKCKMLFIYGSNDPWSGAAILILIPTTPMSRNTLYIMVSIVMLLTLQRVIQKRRRTGS